MEGDFKVLKSKYELKDLEKINACTLSLVDLIFHNTVIHAMTLLIDHVDCKVKTEQTEDFNRTAYYMAKLIKPFHRSFYDELCELTSRDLLAKHEKLCKLSIEEMSSNYFDYDCLQIYRFLKSICENLWHIPILHKFTTGFDPTKFEFEVNAVCHDVVSWEKK